MSRQGLPKQAVSAGGNGVSGVTFGSGELILICGPCVIESRDHTLRHAEQIRKISERVGVPLVFKASYDKANRTSGSSFRGIGMDEGLAVLAEVRREFALPVISDVHAETEVAAVSAVVDILQIPAFLCRQTSLLIAAANTAKPVMVKKGQFLAPQDMAHAVEKIRAVGNRNVLLCERGTCFGYRELIVDFRGLSIMAGCGVPVVFDATHSVQVMGGVGGSSGGDRAYVGLLARAAIAAGVDALFVEAHENPDSAPSDGPNMVPLSQLEPLLRDAKQLHDMKLETR